MVKQRPVKIYKHFSIENKSIAIGCRHKNVINNEIGQCLGCGVDAIGWLSLKIHIQYVYTVYRVIFFIPVAFSICVYCT